MLIVEPFAPHRVHGVKVPFDVPEPYLRRQQPLLRGSGPLQQIVDFGQNILGLTRNCARRTYMWLYRRKKERKLGGGGGGGGEEQVDGRIIGAVDRIPQSFPPSSNHRVEKKLHLLSLASVSVCPLVYTTPRCLTILDMRGSSVPMRVMSSLLIVVLTPPRSREL